LLLFTTQTAAFHGWQPGEFMETIIVSAIALLLFFYLLAAIIRPERF